MHKWHRHTLLTVGAVGLIGVVIPRYLWFRRRRFGPQWRLSSLIWRGQEHLALAHLPHGHERLVIVAHGLLKSMSTPGIMRMAEMLGERFDVLSFDFPGHGDSLGELPVDFEHAARTLSRVVAHGRSLGYERVAVLGYSLGGAAAIIATATGAPIDAVVAVSSPVQPSGNGHVAAWSLRTLTGWMRLMGSRVSPSLNNSSWPIEFVAQVSPTPLMIVHCGLDTLIPREHSEALFAVARPPKDYVHVPWALHAAPTAAAKQIIAWLDERMPSAN